MNYEDNLIFLSDIKVIQTYNHLVRNQFGQMVSVCLRTKWLWVRISLLSLKLQLIANDKSFFVLFFLSTDLYWTSQQKKSYQELMKILFKLFFSFVLKIEVFYKYLLYIPSYICFAQA